MKTSVFTLMSAALLMAGTALAEPFKLGDVVPADLKVTDQLGKEHTFGEFRGKVTVLEWANYECPFVKKHYGSGNMQALQAETVGKGAIWLSVNSSADGKQGHLTTANAPGEMAKNSAKPTYLILDGEGKLGKAFGAETTPHMFVLDKDGKVAYMGAIDSIPSFSKEDVKVADNYVRNAMSDLLADKEVSVPQTRSYGCSVKY